MTQSQQKLAVVYHPDFELHDTGNQHPENCLRARRVADALRADDISESLQWFTPEMAEAKWLEKVHSAEYRQFIEEACLSGRHSVDMGETVVCDQSYAIARLAAGAAMQAVDLVFSPDFKRSFACVRPPGHHARYEQAMGFCLFNNIAIAAAYADATYGLERIAIVDWDVHHGNGTQETFYNSPKVMFSSLHQLPLYPHSGERVEEGLEMGHGYTLNLPLPAGSDGGVYRSAFNLELLPALKQFRPQLILISCGFDAHRDDPLADMKLTEADYQWMTRQLAVIADEFCQGRIVSILEGGYHPQALASSAIAHVRELLGA